MNKLLYKPLAMVVSALGGIAASVAFQQIWKRVAGEDDVPSATDRHHSWREVIIAAAVQGAIFGAVKAAARAHVTGVRPLGLTRPVTTSPTAWPASLPKNHAASTASACSTSQGTTSGRPENKTTITGFPVARARSNTASAN